jgi:hypothetical protein
MIERTTDAAFLNRVLNDPAVRPWVADVAEGKLDLSPRVADDNNVCLIGEHGAFLCFKFMEGMYEVHTQILPSGRGEWARKFAEAGAHHMFMATDCIEILTRVPEGHVAAAALTRAMGFRLQFNTPPECLFRGKRVPCAIHALSLQDWSMRVSPENGERFHEWLNQKVAVGEPHAPDPDHNRIVAVTLDMMRGGQIGKAVAWYNRWAIVARHTPIRLLSFAPPQIRFDAGILTLEGGQIRFEPCH